jgi:hypothetical protein
MQALSAHHPEPMSTHATSTQQAAACGALGLRASWREGTGAIDGSRDSGAGIGLVVVDASRRPSAVPVGAGMPSHFGGAANGLFAQAF